MQKRARSEDNAEVKIPDRVAAGTVLVKLNTLLPDSTWIRSSSIGGWSALSGVDSTDLEGRIRGHRWHFFYIVPAISKRSIALSREAAIAKSIAGAVKKVDEQGLNAVEVVSLDVTRVLGVYVARLHVQPRHIRRDPFITDLKPHRWANWKPDTGVPPKASAESAFPKAA